MQSQINNFYSEVFTLILRDRETTFLLGSTEYTGTVTAACIVIQDFGLSVLGAFRPQTP